MTINKKIIKQALFVAALMVGALSLVHFLPIASAASLLDQTDNVVSENTGGEGSLRVLVLRIINYFLGFLGLLAVIMVIFGGVMYVTAAGKDEQTGKAKKIIMFAVIGIIIILLSFALVNTVIGATPTA